MRPADGGAFILPS